MADRVVRPLTVGLIRRRLEARKREANSDDFLADRTPTTTDTPIRTIDTTDPDEENAVQGLVLGRRHRGRPGLTAAFVWGAVGTITALDRVDSFDRTAIPGAMTVSVTDPGTMVVFYEGPAEFARYADATANARNATRWSAATDATIVVNYAANTPTWQQLRLAVTGPEGAAVPISTYRSTARYDVTPGQLGRAVARFEASSAGQYRVSAARATEPGATLAVGDNFARDIAMTTLGAAILGLVTVLAAVLLTVATYRARSRTTG